jgi:hypothetical protein
MNAPDQKFQPMKVITEMAPSFRTYSAEGVWGMVNNSGNLQFFFYIDRLPLPTSMVFKGPGQPPSDIVLPLGSDDQSPVVREFQSSVVVTIEGAQQIRTVIDNFIRIAETANKQLETK